MAITNTNIMILDSKKGSKKASSKKGSKKSSKK